MVSVQSLGIVLLIALVVFGPSKLPEIGKALGKSIKEFKSSATEEEVPAQQPQQAQQITNVTEQPKELPPKINETTKQ
ncbi:MAG: twin-arginine translocase TatA/TatE family subunit [Selenomonas sp.]|nr:twin-arginine translocase TatA/TatE family subunit [Selenomonas sp.]